MFPIRKIYFFKMFPERKIYFRKMFPKRKKRRPLGGRRWLWGGISQKLPTMIQKVKRTKLSRLLLGKEDDLGMEMLRWALFLC